MGQRHQFYVIAKIGSRHRLLAVAHHQWLQGTDAIVQCAEVLGVFSSRQHASSIKRELKRAAQVDWDKDIWLDRARATDSLFPFIATCLLIGSSIKSQWQPILLSLDTDFMTVPNDDGASIYDITDPCRPRYAFMFPGDNVLKDASQWAMLCRNWVPAVTRCHAFQTVALDAMRSLWPQHKGEKFSSSIPDSHGHEPDGVELGKLSLREQSLSRLLDTAFVSEGLEWLTEAELLPEFLPALKAKIDKDPSLLLSPHGPELLAKVLYGEECLDLTPFPLSAMQLRPLLEKIWRGKTSDQRLLKLPDNADLTEDIIQSIIREFTPTVLDLGETPKISLRALLKTMADSSVRDFTCAALYRRSLVMTGQLFDKVDSLSTADIASRYAYGYQLSQAVFMRVYSSNDSEKPARLANDNIDWSKLIPAAPVWNHKDESKAAAFPLSLRDAFLGPDRAPELLPLAELLCLQDPSDAFGMSIGMNIQGLARKMAHAGGTIRPIPVELFTSWGRYACSSVEHPPKSFEIAPGQWTCLIMHEIHRTTASAINSTGLRYAFISRNTDGSLQVLDATQFLRAAAEGSEKRFIPAIKAWRRAAKDLVSRGMNVHRVKLESSSEEEVQEALKFLEARNAKLDAYYEKNKNMLDASRARIW